MYTFDWSFFWGDPGLRLLRGFIVTIQLASLSAVCALVIGTIVGLVRWQGWRVTEPFCWLYVEFVRNTPIIVQILFWYFSASLILPPWLFKQLRDVGFEFGSVVIALSIYHGAFAAEIIRAGLAAVPRGQYDASLALGLSYWQRMWLIILPQAVRISLPSLVNELVGLVKNTSFAFAIGLAELTYATKYIETYDFRGVEALFLATLLYLVLCMSVSGLAAVLNGHLSRHQRC